MALYSQCGGLWVILIEDWAGPLRTHSVLQSSTSKGFFCLLLCLGFLLYADFDLTVEEYLTLPQCGFPLEGLSWGVGARGGK